MSIQFDYMRLVQRINKLHMAKMPDGLSRGEFFLLQKLHFLETKRAKEGGVYTSTLADEMQVTAPAVSRMLRALEMRGAVKRSVDTEDRRNTLITITDEGEKLRKKTEIEVNKFFNRVFTRLGDEDLATLLRLWEKMIDVMEEEMKAMQSEETETC